MSRVRRQQLCDRENRRNAGNSVGCSTFFWTEMAFSLRRNISYTDTSQVTCLETEEFLRAQFQVDCKILETVLELVMYMACIFLTFRRLNCIYFLNEWL